MEFAPKSGRPAINIDEDLAAARRYSREVKIACDDLHDNPFSADARAKVLRLIAIDSEEADEAWLRAIAHHGASL